MTSSDRPFSPSPRGGEGRGEGTSSSLSRTAPGSPPPLPGPLPACGERESARAALAHATARFGFSATARLDAELLLAHALGVSRERLLLGIDEHAVPTAFADLVARRAKHEPVAYITGTRAFWTIELAVDPRVLIPRPDTETLLEAAVEHFRGTPGPASVLDLGTGSGALLLAALDQWPGATAVGVDQSHDAIAVARGNVRALGLGERARIAWGNWSGAATTHRFWRRDGFDLVLCNPPYIAAGAALPREVADYEPAAALYSGPDGHDDLLQLAGVLRPLIAPGGVACIEIGHDQGAWASALFRSVGFAVALRQDLGGRDRCLVITP